MNEKLYTTPGDALRTAEVLGTGEKGRYLLAATFGNVHGVYKPGNVKLRPEILKEIQDAVGQKVGRPKPFELVFHGGSGSALEEIREALSYGVVKMNVDTDTQYAFTREIAGHMFTNYDGVLKVDDEVGNKKAYDPRSYLKRPRVGMADAGQQGLRGPAVGRDRTLELTRAAGRSESRGAAPAREWHRDWIADATPGPGRPGRPPARRRVGRLAAVRALRRPRNAATPPAATSAAATSRPSW